MQYLIWHLTQTWQAIGWNGLTAIASLLSALASLILAIETLKRRTELHTPPTQRIDSKPLRKPHRRKKRNKKRIA